MEKVVLAMSGGVDSSVAVDLLQKQGYEVYGYTFLCVRDARKREEIRRDSAAAAAAFGIPHFIEDITDEFEEKIIKRFEEQYLSAGTPNPCVFCNQLIKFPKVLAYADKLGIRKVATGHYVRTEDGFIRKGADSKKDQSYFLCQLPREIVSRAVFPLGNYTKEQVREMASALSLSSAEKSDSQEICFIPGDDYKLFLSNRCGARIIPGDFVNKDGEILGRHRGIPFYTVGQRRGIGIAFGEPKYVTGLNAADNTVIIGDEKDLYSSSCVVKNMNLLKYERGVFNCFVKIRYLSAPVPAEVICLDDRHCEVRFAEPRKAVTPGQFAAFYDGDLLIGGGEIE